MWHWIDGEFGDKYQYVQVDLRGDKISETERLTSVLPDAPSDIAEPGVSVKDLGEQKIRGVRAGGVSTTTMPNDDTGNPRPTIHEVWISPQMHLVMKIVDGNPLGDEVSNRDLITSRFPPKSTSFNPYGAHSSSLEGP
jgi:hypothetical protein